MTWRVIDKGFLVSHTKPLPTEAILSYFDGRVPQWSDVLTDDIPRRGAAKFIIRRLLDRSTAAPPRPQVNLVLGASGEGKSTIIRQIAVDISRSSEPWQVLWREPGTDLDPDLVIAIPQDGTRRLFVADDADQIVSNCIEALSRLEGRNDIHFLLAARDTDWRSAGGFSAPWRLYAELRSDLLRGLDKADAESVVQAWSRYGSKGLGRLHSYGTLEDRAERLLEAASAEAHSEEGAFFGAMLRVRFGEDLDEHVKELMRRLARRTIAPDRTLLTGFSRIAALHAINILTLTPAVLATALRLEPDDIVERVVVPLGEEAAGAMAGGYILTRHRAVAEAAIRVAEALGLDVPVLYSSLVRAGIRTARRTYVPDLDQYRYMSRHFDHRLDIAQAVAFAAYEEESRDLQRLTTLWAVLAKVGRHRDISELAERVIPQLNKMDNRDRAIRRFYFTWSVAEGQLGRYAVACWLAAVSVSDIPRAILQDDRDLRTRLSGIGAALIQLLEVDETDTFKLGLASIVSLMPSLDLDAPGERYLARYRERVGRMQVATPAINDALNYLQGAAVAAWSIRERELHEDVPSGNTLRFTGLRGRFLSKS